jgi:hypothetical protein
VFFDGRGAPCLYLQDEAAIITLANGEPITFYGTPWHPLIGGIFQYNQEDSGTGAGTPPGPSHWGAAGEAAHVVLCHGPPRYILDSVDSKKGAPIKLAGRAVGGAHLLAKLRSVQPAVMAFGHVHAEQGLQHLRWTKDAEARQYRKDIKAAFANDTPLPDPPPGMPRKRRVVRGDDLSDVGAGVLLDPAPLAALEADLRNTLFVNAANLNATTPLVQHGVRYDADSQRLLLLRPGVSRAERKPLRQLRPPIVVRVFPGRGTPAVLLPLGIERFPEW